MAAATLILRDIHQPPAPAWWPPAPGWWIVAAIVLAAVALALALQARKRRRQRERAALFDEAVAAAATPDARVAAMSELLRRAARLHDPAADRLQGDDWLDFLDAGDPARPFSTGAGRLVLDGGFRRDVDAAEVDALRDVARVRFLRWMQAR